MRNRFFITLVLLPVVYITHARTYHSTGERIYKTGRNDGRSLLDKSRSSITIFKSCQACHGPSGTRVNNCNIQWSYLTDVNKLSVPYTKELFYRFLDDDLKSDGSKAETGVHWQMSMQEKDALILYLQQIR